MARAITLVGYGIEAETIARSPETDKMENCAAQTVVSKEQVMLQVMKRNVAFRLLSEKIISWYAEEMIHLSTSHANRLQRLDQRQAQEMSIFNRQAFQPAKTR